MSEQDVKTGEPTAGDWGDRLRQARQDKERAAAVYEQTVRDAHADGRAVAQMSRDLGIKDRTRLSAIAGGEAAQDTPGPRLPLVVDLQGGARPDAVEEINRSMAARGWYAISSHQDAWYLSRAGATVVQVFFPRGLDTVTVRLVRAVHAQPATEASYAVKDLLPTMAGISLERAHPEAADFRVAVQTVAEEWKVLAERTYARPEAWYPEMTNNGGTKGAAAFDPTPLARWVADIIE
ncbi:hypothetical protein ACWF9B_08695 [Streptomyces sp. NPDC055089]